MPKVELLSDYLPDFLTSVVEWNSLEEALDSSAAVG